MGTPQNQQPIVYDIKRAERFYSKLRARIVPWLKENRGVSDRVRDYLLLLPDLFVLLIRLIRDPRGDLSLKVQLIGAGSYVISPIDLVPDLLLPYGLIDDVAALAFVLSRLVRIMGQAGEDILREHWEGEGDVLVQIEQIAATADAILNAGILSRLRRLFG